MPYRVFHLSAVVKQAFIETEYGKLTLTAGSLDAQLLDLVVPTVRTGLLRIIVLEVTTVQLSRAGAELSCFLRFYRHDKHVRGLSPFKVFRTGAGNLRA